MKTKYEAITEKPIDELAEWLSDNTDFIDEPWFTWFDKHFCQKCARVFIEDKPNMEYAFCELNNHCRFYPCREPLEPVEIIKMWLESPADKE